MMPFSRYLQGGERDGQQDEFVPSARSSNNAFVQFQMPQFMYSGPPTLALGGGAEVVPGPMFNPSAATSWFSNNGFTPPATFGAIPSNDES
jgi:hypothetical protein